MAVLLVFLILLLFPQDALAWGPGVHMAIGNTVLAVHNQISPPTINIFEQDPECDLDYCANVAREMKIDVAMKNNFGFGGTNGTLVFRRV